MSTTAERTVAAPAGPPPSEIVRVHVPARSWRSELRAIKIVWRRELLRFKSDRMRIVTALVQPLLFLFVLGSGLQQLSSASTNGVNLKTFIYPGILCIAVMFTAMFSAASIVWDREFGFLREMMVAPVRRSSIVIGKCLGGAARIVNRHRRLVRQQIEQGPRRSSDPRMGQRLVEGVSAAGIVEGLDAQGHDDEPIPEPQSAFGPILHSSRSSQAIGAISCSSVR